jgi:hypothetical protein
MRRNFLPLIGHLIREISREDAMGAKGMLAYQCYGESDNGKVDRASLEDTIQMLTGLDMLQHGMVLSCGLTAKTFCRIFTGSAELANTCTLAELRELVKDRRARLIRIDLRGHAYVIEQVESTENHLTPRGNVYQSNIAVIANSELGISLKKYLDENPNPVDLHSYFDQLATVTSDDAPASTRLDVYKKLYTAPSYLSNPEVKSITEQDLTEASASLEVTRLSYQDFEERNVLRGVSEILSAYRNILGANQARDIYFSRCWV